MNTETIQKIQVWLNGNYDDATKNSIKELQENNQTELEDSFYKNLEFGTGGLRGIMGVGTNRMNKYTVGMATQGFANYLKKTYVNTEIRVVVGHDSRNIVDFLLKQQPMFLQQMVLKFFCFLN